MFTISTPLPRRNILVSLPPACDRNEFALRIVRKLKTGRVVLAEEEFTWSADESTKRFTFSPKELAAGGTGKYEIEFHSAAGKIFSRGFHVKPPKPPAAKQ